MTGLLRFSPDKKGGYTARFSPDHFILPSLGEYFTERFGETDWAIIDEKRGLCLSRFKEKQASVTAYLPDRLFTTGLKSDDDWEELWRHYHKTINNESRKNTCLQRQFMPKRYWKYLPEM